MAETEINISNEINSSAQTASVSTKSPKSKKPKVANVGGGQKKSKTKPNHPPTSEMVQSAIKALKERGGSSLQAIKKYISATYKIDADKLSPFIKKYLKSAVTNGQLVQTKGKGASGSFKISAALKPKVVKKIGGGDESGKSLKSKTNKMVGTKKVANDKSKLKSVSKKSNATNNVKKSATKQLNVSDKKKASVVSVKSIKKSNSGIKSTPKQKSTKPKADAALKRPKTPKPKKTAPKKAAAKK